MSSGAQVVNTWFLRGEQMSYNMSLISNDGPLYIIVRSRHLVFDVSVLLCEESGFVHPVEKSLDSSLNYRWKIEVN